MNPIGFAKECLANRNTEKAQEEASRAGKPAVPSVVRVKFHSCSRELDYFNDQFDLRPGDLVFVDGKLAGQRGRVTAVSRHFKIKADDYKRVIGLADIRVSGQFRSAGSHLVTFDRRALPYDQFRSWVLPPRDDDTEYFVRFDEEDIDLDHLDAWRVDPGVRERGIDYYRDNRVLYLCLDGRSGKAIVDGTQPYEVEFRYDGGMIPDLSCDCPCGYHCKHEVAALLQLRETLAIIREQSAADWPSGGCFAAVLAPLFFSLAVDGNSKMILTLAQSDC